MDIMTDVRHSTVRCPVCRIPVTDKVCPDCDIDLSLVRECQDLAAAAYNLGLSLAKRRRKDNLENAEDCLKLAISLKSDFAEPRIVLGKLAAQRGRYPDAIAYWTEAIRFEPENTEAHDCLNKLREVLGGDTAMRLEAKWQDRMIRIGCDVQSADGFTGRLNRIIPGNPDSQITHLVVSMGRLFPRNMLVPANTISSVRDNVISLHMLLDEMVSKTSRFRNNSVLKSSVLNALMGYDPIRSVDLSSIEVAASDGEITLSGNITSGITKKRAEELTRSVKGVIAVRNMLVCDGEIELAAAEALANNPTTKDETVFVKSYLGNLVIEGEVGSRRAQDTIEDVVSGVYGVRGTVNRLTVGHMLPAMKNKQGQG